ncbi:MAG: hypothetical protein E6I17_02240 [Chloroflexi bacterium]|nr:MAG: hypothetical protein E6I17_02240 [Chloroflexota bacterium]
MRLQGVTGRVVIGCLVAAVVVFAALSLMGYTRAGIAVGLGLLLGSINGAPQAVLVAVAARSLLHR